MEKYNLSKLVKIRVVKPRISMWYDFEEGRRSFWIGKIKRGIYDYFQEYIGDNVKNHFVKDRKVYEFAECTLYFENDFTYTYYFETYKEAKDKANVVEGVFKEMFGYSLVELDKV